MYMRARVERLERTGARVPSFDFSGLTAFQRSALREVLEAVIREEVTVQDPHALARRILALETPDPTRQSGQATPSVAEPPGE